VKGREAGKTNLSRGKRCPNLWNRASLIEGDCCTLECNLNPSDLDSFEIEIWQWEGSEKRTSVTNLIRCPNLGNRVSSIENVRCTIKAQLIENIFTSKFAMGEVSSKNRLPRISQSKTIYQHNWARMKHNWFQLIRYENWIGRGKSSVCPARSLYLGVGLAWLKIVAGQLSTTESSQFNLEIRNGSEARGTFP